MKVDRIELFHVAIPLPKPFYPAWIPGYPQTVNRFTLVRLTTDDGVQGLAAGVAFEREREGLGGLLGPYLIGSDPTDIPTVRQRIREASYLGWRNYWLEAAFWDIKGRVEGKPVWALLGIRLFFGPIPLLILLVALPLLIWYPITRQSHTALLEKLKAMEA
jgi:L-alanine-DL-glutamate epimerase-like enolase superfamily enzyme